MNMVVHPDAVQVAHQYSCAAAKQKKFNEYKRAFWEKGFGGYAASGGRDKSPLGETNIVTFSAGIGLDVVKLKADANSAECKQRLEEDMKELAKFNVGGTPAFFINGIHIGGGIPKEAFKQIIDERLAIAEKSGVPAAQYYDKEIMGKGVRQFRSKKDAKAAPPTAPGGPAEQAPPTPGGGAAQPGTGSAAKPGAGSAAKPPTTPQPVKPAAPAGSAAKPPTAPQPGSAAKPAGSAQ
jgi:hypothetical protein